MSHRGPIWGAGAVLLVILVLVSALLVSTRGDNGGTATTTPSTATAVTSPYDFTEATINQVDPSIFRDAKFVSLTLETPEGFRSYLVKGGTERFSALVAALSGAKEGDAPDTDPATGGAASTVPDAAGPGSGTTDVGLTASLTVVMPDRTTYTFVIDEEQGVLVRGNRSWKTQTDLRRVLDAATR